MTLATKFMESYKNLQRNIVSEQFIQIKLYADECYRYHRDLETSVHLSMIDRRRAEGAFTR